MRIIFYAYHESTKYRLCHVKYSEKQIKQMVEIMVLYMNVSSFLKKRGGFSRTLLDHELEGKKTTHVCVCSFGTLIINYHVINTCLFYLSLIKAIYGCRHLFYY